jgi:hypothetical protein
MASEGAVKALWRIAPWLTRLPLALAVVFFLLLAGPSARRGREQRPFVASHLTGQRHRS